jgi:hypothetical protein
VEKNKAGIKEKETEEEGFWHQRFIEMVGPEW